MASVLSYTKQGRKLLWLMGCLLALTACSAEKKSESSGSMQEEPMKIRVAIWNANEAFAGDSVLAEVEERLNIRIMPENITWDDYTQKLKLWASARNLPDLFVGDFRNSSVYMEWVRQGLIAEIPEDLSLYPNLKAYLQTSGITENARLNQKLYCIPRQTYPAQEWTSTDRIIVYRWDLAQEAGITKEPQNWEEFQEMILAIIYADPENTQISGMISTGATLLGGMFIPYASCLAAEGGTSFKWVLDTDGIYKPAYFAGNMLPAFQLGRDMYESGTIAADIMLTTAESAEERFLQGKNAALLYSGGVGGEYSTISVYWEKKYGRDYWDDVRVLSLMPDAEGNKAYPVWDYAWSETYISAKADAEKQQRILALYDYLLSEEGAYFTSYGPEGEFYDLVDGKVCLHSDASSLYDQFPSCEAFSIMVRWNPSIYDRRFASVVPESYHTVNRNLAEEAKKIVIPEYNPLCTQIMMEKEISFEIHPNEDFCRIMTGEEPVEKMWEEIKSEYDAEGLTETVKEVNKALGSLED